MLDTTTRERYHSPQQDVGPPCSDPTPCGRIQDGYLVVHSHPQAETWASAELQRRGYQTYLPMMAVRRRDRVIRSHFHTINTPLFPRYLFVRNPGHWTPILYCPGVHQIVMMDGKPGIVATAAISALQAAEAVRATLPPANRQWAPGTPCVVSGGVLEGHPAIVLKVGADMALVSLLMLGQLREVAVALDCLSPRDA